MTTLEPCLEPETLAAYLSAVAGARHPELQSLKARGLKLYACAYGAHRREIPLDDSAAFAGLTVVSDLIAGTERFVSFN